MFYAIVEDNNYTIVFENDHFRLKFTPVESDIFTQDVSDKEGQLNMEPFNGSCCIVYTEQTICFELSHYGSGDKGSLEIRIPNNKEIMDSFRNTVSTLKQRVMADAE